MEQPAVKKQKTAKRSIVCVEGIHIDEKDYCVAKEIFPYLDLTQMTQMYSQHESDGGLMKTIFNGIPVEIGGKSNGFRIRKLNWWYVEQSFEDEDENDDGGYDDYRDYNDFGSGERMGGAETLMLDNDELDALEVLHISIPRVVMAGDAPLWIGRLRNLKELQIKFTRHVQKPYHLSLRHRHDARPHLEIVETPRWIGNLTKLKKLRINFSGREGSQLPDEIGKLVNLETLQIRAKECWENPGGTITISSCIGELTNLKRLALCNIRNLPDEIGNLTNLEEFKLVIGKSPGFPDAMWNLTNLKYLDLSFSLVDQRSDRVKYPDGIGRLTNLEELKLFSYSFNSEISSCLGNLKKLKALHVPMEENSLGFLPSLENLEFLVLDKPFTLDSHEDFEELRDMSKIFGKIVPLLVQMKNLRSLKIQPEEVLFHSSDFERVYIPDEENVTHYDNHELVGHMEKVLDGCPYLGCIGHRGVFNHLERVKDPTFCALVDAALRNRLRYLDHSPVKSLILSNKQVPKSLWPFILYKATSERRELLCSKFCTWNKISSCCCHAITEFDAMFHTLSHLLPSEKLAR